APGRGTVPPPAPASTPGGLATRLRVTPAFAGLIAQPRVLARFHAMVGGDAAFAPAAADGGQAVPQGGPDVADGGQAAADGGPTAAHGGAGAGGPAPRREARSAGTRPRGR